MGLLKYCKKLRDDGFCTRLKPWVNPKTDKIEYIDRKCIYGFNHFKLVPTKNEQSNTYRLMNDCPFFESVDGLEKMLDIVGSFEFFKEDYLLFEDDDYYIVTRMPEEQRKQKLWKSI